MWNELWYIIDYFYIMGKLNYNIKLIIPLPQMTEFSSFSWLNNIPFCTCVYVCVCVHIYTHIYAISSSSIQPLIEAAHLHILATMKKATRL